MKIALVTDTHLTPGDSLLSDNWSAADTWLKSVKPDLLVHLGDITANGFHHRDEFAYAHALLTAAHPKVLFLPGNHDIGDNPPADGSHSDEALSPTRLTEYRQIFGADHWSFVDGEWLIVGLNAMLFGTQLDAEHLQLSWLEHLLTGHAGPLGVMLHKPLVPVDASADLVGSRYVPPDSRRQLLQLLSAQNLRFVVAGHTHQSLRFVRDDVEHVWVPSTSFCIPQVMQQRVGEKCVGVMLLDLDKSTHQFSLHEPPGMQRHNLLDLTHIYPELVELRARFGADTAF